MNEGNIPFKEQNQVAFAKDQQYKEKVPWKLKTY